MPIPRSSPEELRNVEKYERRSLSTTGSTSTVYVPSARRWKLPVAVAVVAVVVFVLVVVLLLL